MFKYCIPLFILAQLLFSSCSSPDDVASVDDLLETDTLSCFEKAYFPLSTFDPDATNDTDLAVLKDLIGDAEVVALGECTHGNSELIQVKHRIAKYLVENLGFNVIVFEGGFSDVHNLESDNAEEYLQKLGYWIYDNEEMKNLFQWIVETNDGGTKLAISGFDMQGSRSAIASLEEQTENSDDSELKELVSNISATTSQLYELKQNKGNYEPKLQLSLELEAVAIQLKKHVQNALSETQPNTQERLLAQYANFLIQNAQFDINRYSYKVNQEGVYSYNYRDSAMAANILWLRDYYAADAKIIVWAHNSHVSKADNSMGSWLNTALKDSLFIIGTDAYQGFYTAKNKNTDTVSVDSELLISPTNSFGQKAHSTGLSSLVFVPQYIRNECPQEADSFATSRMRSLGWRTTTRQFREANLMQDYDAIIFLDSVTPIHPIYINSN